MSKKAKTDYRSIAAYHEAGHAVVAHRLGAKVLRVSIDDDGGKTQIRRLGGGERAILVNLAGPYAQKRYAPRSHWHSHSHTGFNRGTDFDNVTSLIYEIHGRGEVAEKYWRYVEARAEKLVEQSWRYIDAVAKVLLKHGVITGDIRYCFRKEPAPFPFGDTPK
jgi:hypothetical protein